MSFDEIYNTVIPKWGDKINIADGIIVEPKKTSRPSLIRVSSEPGFYSETLSNLWQTVEEGVRKENIFAEHLSWIIYQHLLLLAKDHFLNQQLEIHTGQLDKIKLEEALYIHLLAEGDPVLLNQYQRP